VQREEAVAKIRALVGRSLHELAKDEGVAIVAASGKVNKGWAGQTLELAIGLSTNSSQKPDGGDWELKVVPFKESRGTLVPKETMAITMINADQVASTPFEESHLLSKLESLVIVKRLVGRSVHERSEILDVRAIDLHGELYEQIRLDYIEVQKCILDSSRGFQGLSGSMGVLVQPRTKGAGHGSISRAFYARPSLVSAFFSEPS
jgi:DNA mismatch repair protein MutH